MLWRVEAYEHPALQGAVDVQAELLRLENDADPNVAVGAARLMGWLRAVHNGNGTPECEPDTPRVEGCTLKYRCNKGALVIFSIHHPPRLVVLKFSRAASSYPTVADCSDAVARWKTWSP